MTTRPRIQHVSIPRPPDSGQQTRSFYSELLGLEEIATPTALSALDLIWYKLGDAELHIFAEEPRADDSGRHVCIEFEDVHALRHRLEQAGVTVQDTTPIPNRPRFFCRDPFGNTLEITTIEGPYS